MHIKGTLKFHLKIVRRAKGRKTNSSHAGEDVEKRKYSPNTSGTATLNKLYGNQYEEPLEVENTATSISSYDTLRHTNK